VSAGSAPTVSDVAEYLGAWDQLSELGPARTSQSLTGAAPVYRARAGEITFLDHAGGNGRELLARTAATLVLAPLEPSYRASAPASTVTLGVVAPRLAFIRVLGRFFAPQRPIGIHPRAAVDDHANVAASAYVGPLATVAADVSIGERTVIHAGVHIYPGCRVGADCTIHAGAVIGADGFGYERNEQGEPEHFPHLGTVVIEDDVEIGANACIDRGTLDPTVIHAHSRIDDLVYIAHNVDVGEGALIVGSTMVAGGVRLGARSWIAASATLKDGIRVGDDAVIGIGSVAYSDVPAGTTVVGVPARELGELKTFNAALRELVKRGADCVSSGLGDA
jgi:UDP-3-O-[3-hydroxymyristoyl] glucosamine N-acyltransferase